MPNLASHITAWFRVAGRTAWLGLALVCSSCSGEPPNQVSPPYTGGTGLDAGGHETSGGAPSAGLGPTAGTTPWAGGAGNVGTTSGGRTAGGAPTGGETTTGGVATGGSRDGGGFGGTQGEGGISSTAEAGGAGIGSTGNGGFGLGGLLGSGGFGLGGVGSGGFDLGGAGSGGFGLGGVGSGGFDLGGAGSGGLGSGGTGGSVECSVTPAARTLLTDVDGRLALLTSNTADWWLSHGIDATYGGFYGTLNAQGNSVAPSDKGLIQQARHLWAFSMYCERRGAPAAAKVAADSTYEFIVSHMRDPSDGEFYFKVNETGTTVVDSTKLLYAQGFAIYALAEYGRVFNVQAAKDYALACFRHLDARAHDATYGGYDQRNDAPGWLGTGVEKETNTHIHLMEAYTALYRATSDATVSARLNELIDVVATKLLQPSNYVAQNFKVDWALVGNVFVSYGHDLETAWLLLDAAQAAGRDAEAGVRAAALAMGRHSSERGLNAMTGAYNYEGVPNTATVTNTEHIWWVEFESLSGNYWLYRLSCDPVYLERLESTLDWIEARRDPTGEWYWGNLPDGSIGPRGTNKGEEWKASYHDLRALVFVGDWVHATLN
jgi:mannobiose 2-epimerase